MYEKVYLREVGVEGISSSIFVGVYLLFYVYVSKIIGVSTADLTTFRTSSHIYATCSVVTQQVY